MCPSDSRVPSGRPQRVKNLAGFLCQVEGWSGEPASTNLPQSVFYFGWKYFFFFFNFSLRAKRRPTGELWLKELSVTG
jgi:hypothetical protein